MLLQLHPGLMIWTIITFLVLVLVLRLVAWKPILALLDAREKKIQGDIDSAASNREEAEKTMSEVRDKLDKARKEANEIVASARSQAERVKDETLAATKEEGAALIQRAKEEIALERDKAAQALREEFADLAVQAAGQIIGQKLSPKEHNNIIRKTIGEIN